jgi:hypothetical protein
LIRRIERPQIYFNLVFVPSEDRRSAAGAEVPTGILTRLALDSNRVVGEDRGSVKQRAMVLPTVEAVTNPNSVGSSGRRNSDVAAQAAAGEPFHDFALF